MAGRIEQGWNKGQNDSYPIGSIDNGASVGLNV